MEPEPTEVVRGGRLFRLLYESPEWAHRRVDGIVLDEDGATRRHVSLDFTLPKEFAISTADGRTLVPLGLMVKEPLRRLDLTVEGHGAAVVLTARQNGELAVTMLMAVASAISPSELPLGRLRSRLRSVVFCPVDKARYYTDMLDQWLMEQAGGPGWPLEQRDLFLRLANEFAENFLFAVELDSSVIGQRTLLKYSVDHDMPPKDSRRTRRTVIRQEIVEYGFAASQHVEVRLPSGLVVDRLEIVEAASGNPRSADRPKRARSIGHCAATPTDRLTGAMWVLKVRPPEQGLYAFASVAVFSVLLIVLCGLVLRAWGDFVLGADATIPSPSASILLLWPAVFLSWMSRKPEHEIVSRLVRPLRRMLLRCAACLVVLAGMAAVPLRPGWWEFGWAMVSLVAVWNVIGWVLYRADVDLRRRHRQAA